MFTEKLQKLPNRREQAWLKFPNGYCVHVSKEEKYGKQTTDKYMVLLMHYVDPVKLEDTYPFMVDPNDVKYVVTTYTSEYCGIEVSFKRTFGADGLSEEGVNDFIEQVKSLPKICDVPDTWND